ncbi:MAG TPA: hypothetical protein VHX86_10775 [Tepidisphaeraceae bacterium]|nr:hypothetical protein [Tepidisphaeraceae bacterium]
MTKASPDRGDRFGIDAQVPSDASGVSPFGDAVARVKKNHDRMPTKAILVHSSEHGPNVFILLVPMICDLDRADARIEMRDPPEILGIAVSEQLAFLNEEFLHLWKDFVLAVAIDPRIAFISISLLVQDEHCCINHSTRTDVIRGL